MHELSIIIPVYNTAPFLSRCIDSILAQSFTDWEMILVDDGSTDESGVLCDKYQKKDSRITVIHKANGGAGSARNVGLDAADGKYIVFPDSDDWIDKDAYQYGVERMDKNGVDLLLFGSINTVYDEDETIISEEKGKIHACLYTTQEECRAHWSELMESQPMGGPSNKMYRASVIREHHLRFPDLRRMQDGVFNMLFFDHISGFEAVEEYFYHFTLHPSDYQRKKIPKDYVKCAVVFHKTAINMLRRWNMNDAAHRDVMDRRFVEWIVTSVTQYLPQGTNVGFLDIYRYMRSISGDEYVHRFFTEYAKTHQLRKIERAIGRKMNLALAVNSRRSTQ